MKFIFNALSGTFDAVLNLASEILYDNASSGLTADNVQDAIDELQTEIDGLPDPITYKGTWNASTNTPTLSNSDTGVTGFLYQCNVAGTVDFGAGPISFEVGDKVVNNGTIWEKWDMTDAVTSVNGQTGAVTVNAINELTGDASAGPAAGSQSAALTLATVNSNIGTFASVTVNGKGLVTAATALSGDATTSGAALTLATVNSNIGSFGSASSVGTFTVNGKGLVTAAGSTSIQIAESQVTNLVSDLAAKITNPMTTGGDLIYGGASGTPTRLANGSSGQFLKSAGGTSAPTWSDIATVAPGPTVQRFTSGSGTYTTPASVAYIVVRMVGGGGGGSGSGSAGGGNGGSGGDTTFGTTLLSAGGGGGGQWNGPGGAGGSSSLGTGPIGLNLTGSDGSATSYANTASLLFSGARGGDSPYFTGAGARANAVSAGQAGIIGGGGQGGGNNNTSGVVSGSGGGAGGFIDAIIVSPSSTYAYAVGAAGSAGSSGTSGLSGGAGGSGYIEVTEYYTPVGITTTVLPISGGGTGNSSAGTSGQVLVTNGSTSSFASTIGPATGLAIVGTNTNNNASAGQVGEYISANPGAPVTPATSLSYANVTSISLTAGDWDVDGVIVLSVGNATTPNTLYGGVSLSSANTDTISSGGFVQLPFSFGTGATCYAPTGTRRISVNSTTTVYLVAGFAYAALGTAVYGADSFLRARRVR